MVDYNFIKPNVTNINIVLNKEDAILIKEALIDLDTKFKNIEELDNKHFTEERTRIRETIAYLNIKFNL